MSSSAESTLYVVVPCHNDAQIIESVIDEAFAIVGRLSLSAEFLLMDNGSTDDTPTLLEGIARKHENAHFERLPEEVGLGSVVERAWERVPPGSWTTILPGDREFDFASIETFWNMRESYDVILGYPQNQVVRPVSRRIASHLFHTAARVAYGFPFRFLNGMKLYRRDAFYGLDVVSHGPIWSAELLAKAILRNPLLRIGEAPFVLLREGKPTREALPPHVLFSAFQEFLRGAASVSGFRNEIIASGALDRKDDDA